MQSMHGGSYLLLKHLYGPLNLANMTVCRNDVHVDGENVGPYAFKLIVSMDVPNDETTCLIQVNNGLHFSKDSCFGSGQDLCHSAETNFFRWSAATSFLA